MSDWTEHQDPGSGRSYFYNASTGVTSWDPPPGWGAAPAAAPAASEWQEVVDPGSGRPYYYNATTGVTSWDPPPGWGAPVKSAASGVSSRSMSVSDEPSSTRKSGAGRKSMIGRRSGIAKRNTAKPTTVGDKLAARAKKFVAMRKAEKTKNQPSSFARKRNSGSSSILAKAVAGADTPVASPPSDWQAATTDDGKTYYYNTVTGETSWSLPA